MKPDYSRETRRILVCGPSGSGKSTWTLDLLRAWRGRLLAWDHKGEVSRRLGVRMLTTVSELRAALPDRRGRVAFQPHRMFADDLGAGWDWFCGLARGVAEDLEGETLLYVDELQDWIDPRTDLPRSFRWCLESGRVHGLNFVGVAQAANFTHNRLRQQLTEVVAFGQSEPRALEFLRACGMDADRVSRLPRFAFLHRSRVTGAEQEGRIDWPSGRVSVSPQRALL